MVAAGWGWLLRTVVQQRQKDMKANNKFDFSWAIDVAPDSIFVVERSGTIVFANAQAAACFGYEPGELTGKTIEELVPQAYRANHEKLRSDYMENPRSRPMGTGIRCLALRKDGTEFPVDVMLNYKEQDGKLFVICIARDITSLRSIYKELSRAEQRVSAILDKAHDAFVAADRHGKITEWNSAAETMFGLSQEEAVGQLLTETIIPPRYRQAHSHGFSRFLEQAGGYTLSRRIEVSALHRDGHEFAIELGLFSVDTEEGRSACAFIRDISERKESESRLKEFYSIVSHELRAPLTAIRGSLGLVEGGVTGQLPEEAKDLLGMARTSCDRLIGLINDILDLGKIEAGKLELHLEPVSPGFLVESALGEIAVLAQQASVEILSNVQADRLVVVDSNRIVQVLLNLLSNAIKFSPQGSKVNLEVVCLPGDRLRFSVTDQGPGIPDTQLGKLFGKFEQVGTPDIRQTGGTGLGLSISKEIVQKHKGAIGVDSQAGAGSTFWFELPAS